MVCNEARCREPKAGQSEVKGRYLIDWQFRDRVNETTQTRSFAAFSQLLGFCHSFMSTTCDPSSK